MMRGVINHPTKGIFMTSFCKVVGDDGIKREPTMEEMEAEMERVAGSLLDDTVTELSVHFVDENLIPKDEMSQTFYDALVYNPQGQEAFTYDLAKARALRVEQLRTLRKDMFHIIDALRAKALESGNKEALDNVARIANELRDMPETAMAALEELGNIESIASYIPSVFGELASA